MLTPHRADQMVFKNGFLEYVTSELILWKFFRLQSHLLTYIHCEAVERSSKGKAKFRSGTLRIVCYIRAPDTFGRDNTGGWQCHVSTRGHS